MSDEAKVAHLREKIAEVRRKRREQDLFAIAGITSGVACGALWMLYNISVVWVLVIRILLRWFLLSALFD